MHRPRNNRTPLVPVGVAQCDATEREEAPVGEAARFVQEEEMHPCIGTRDAGSCQSPAYEERLADALADDE